MKFFTAILSLFSVIVVVTGSRADSRASLKFSDITKPDFFPIFAWDACRGWDSESRDYQRHGLKSIADCNFNLAGFVSPKELAECRKLGVGAIVLPPREVFGKFTYFKEWRNLSDDEIDRRIKTTVKAAGNNPAVMGYFITDEPGVVDFPALSKAVAAVKKYAPGKLAYINLFPDYATIGSPDMSQLGTSNYTEYLEKFVAEVKPQAISYDNYMVPFSNDLENMSKGASYFRNLLEVRRVATKHNLPYLNIVCANQIRTNYPIPSPANLALQAYTTLAAGYRGVTWYTYYGRWYDYGSIDRDGRKTMTWHYLAEINRQIATLAPIMSQLTSTGVYFSSPTIVENLPTLPGQLVQSATGNTPLMIGEFKHRNGDAYVMVVNLSLAKSGKFTLQLKADQTAQKVSAVDGALEPFGTNKGGNWLVAGQGVLLKLGK
jgi:hypothetical protein